MKGFTQTFTTTTMFLLLKAALFLFLNSDSMTRVLSEYGGSADKNDVTLESQGLNQGAETAGVRHKTLFMGRYGSIDIQSNCQSRSSHVNVTTAEDLKALISFSYTRSNESSDVTSFRCWMYMTSPSNTVMSLLRLDKKCSGRGFISVSDAQSHRRWRLCAAAWFAPGLDFTTSSSVVNATIAVNDITVSYAIDIDVQIISKHSEKELEVRHLSATEGKKQFSSLTMTLN